MSRGGMGAINETDLDAVSQCGQPLEERRQAVCSIVAWDDNREVITTCRFGLRCGYAGGSSTRIVQPELHPIVPALKSLRQLMPQPIVHSVPVFCSSRDPAEARVELGMKGGRHNVPNVSGAQGWVREL